MRTEVGWVIMNIEYDIIYSLGTDCACAEYMKKNNLRAVSGPFDWLNHTDFRTRMNCILNDFKDFFNKEDLKFLPKDPGAAFGNDYSHDYYENRNSFYYFHDFPVGVPFDKVFGAVKKTYNRRIRRFKKMLKTKRRVLLVWFAHYYRTDDSEIIALCDLVCRKYNKTIDFLIIEHSENQMVPEKRFLAPNILRIDVHTNGKQDGVPAFLGKECVVSPLFASYRLHVPWAKRILKIFSSRK